MSLDATNSNASQDSAAAPNQGSPAGSSTGEPLRTVPTINDLASQQQNQAANAPAGSQQPSGDPGQTAGEQQPAPVADPFLSQLGEFGFQGLTTREEAEQRLFDDYRAQRAQAERA